MIREYMQNVMHFILGIQEYHEAFKPRSERSRNWSWRFWGRIGLAAFAAIIFFSQQVGLDVHLFTLTSEFVAYAVLYIGLLQAAVPLFYLIVRFFFWFFVTERYKRDIERRKWPEPWKSAVVIASEAVLIVLSALGFLSHPWYLILPVFLWSFPVAFFYLILPAFVLWGLGHRVFLSLARFDDRIEQRQGR
jgi:hypothetical protein